jgi:hypothetical protein
MLYCNVKAAPPRWFHLAMWCSLVLLVSLEKELGDHILILSLNPLLAGSSDSIKLHSAYRAIPAWLSLNARDVAAEV